MGFANLVIAEITTNYSQTVERGFSLFNPLKIANKRPRTDLAKDAKAIIYHILPEKSPNGYFRLQLMAKTRTVISDIEIESCFISCVERQNLEGEICLEN
jgi:hypothetical protein